MEERNVLSSEEVEAILKASQSAGNEAMAAEQQHQPAGAINMPAFSSLLDHLCNELENKLTVLFRKRVAVKCKPPVASKIEDCLKQTTDRDTYCSFKLMPTESYSLVCVDFNFLDQSINLLYGGKNAGTAAENISAGKIGSIAAEKISQMVFDSLTAAATEHATVEAQHYKTSRIVSNANHIHDGESVYLTDFNIMFDEVETRVSLFLTEEFLTKLIPIKTNSGKHHEKDSWRMAIKSEVVDSYVTVATTINDVQIKVKDFMNLKEGDVIPISDPTSVYVCLNNLKLFKAVAGQSNSKIIVKVVSQV